MDWMGFESTISALPDTFCQRIVMERQIDAVQTTCIVMIRKKVGMKIIRYTYDQAQKVSKEVCWLSY